MPSNSAETVGFCVLATMALASVFYLGRKTHSVTDTDEQEHPRVRQFNNSGENKAKARNPVTTSSDDDDAKERADPRRPTTRKRSRSFKSRGLQSSHPSYHSLASSGSQHMAVLVVDCQPAYWDNSPCSLAFPEIPQRVSNLLSCARERLSPSQIIHIRANYSHKFVQNFLLLNPERTLPADAEACPWAAAKTGEMVVTKPSFDAFFDTNLREHLRSLGTTHIVVCGMLTSACVLFTCQSAFASGIRITLIENATADRSVETHKRIIDQYGDYLYKVSNDLDFVFDQDTGYDLPPDMN